MIKKNLLAIKSGLPVINYKFKKYNSIGSEEVKAAIKVIKKKRTFFFFSWEIRRRCACSKI